MPLTWSNPESYLLCDTALIAVLDSFTSSPKTATDLLSITVNSPGA